MARFLFFSTETKQQILELIFKMSQILKTRARPRDTSKPHPIYHSSEIEEKYDVSLEAKILKIQEYFKTEIPTGMEKEEETVSSTKKLYCILNHLIFS